MGRMDRDQACLRFVLRRLAAVLGPIRLLRHRLIAILLKTASFPLARLLPQSKDFCVVTKPIPVALFMTMANASLSWDKPIMKSSVMPSPVIRGNKLLITAKRQG